MDPKKVGLVLILLYAVVFAWVMPPRNSGDGEQSDSVAQADPEAGEAKRSPRERQKKDKAPERKAQTPEERAAQRAGNQGGNGGKAALVGEGAPAADTEAAQDKGTKAGRGAKGGKAKAAPVDEDVQTGKGKPGAGAKRVKGGAKADDGADEGPAVEPAGSGKPGRKLRGGDDAPATDTTVAGAPEEDADNAGPMTAEQRAAQRQAAKAARNNKGGKAPTSEPDATPPKAAAADDKEKGPRRSVGAETRESATGTLRLSFVRAGEVASDCSARLSTLEPDAQRWVRAWSKRDGHTETEAELFGRGATPDESGVIEVSVPADVPLTLIVDGGEPKRIGRWKADEAREVVHDLGAAAAVEPLGDAGSTPDTAVTESDPEPVDDVVDSGWEEGRIGVLVVQGEGGAPVPGARIQLSPVDPSPFVVRGVSAWAARRPASDTSRQAFDQGAPAGSDGRLELRVPAGLALRVRAVRDAYESEREILPLEPGEARLVRVELLLPAARAFWGRAVAEDTRDPIPSAVISVDGEEWTRADPLGFFRLDLAPETQRSVFEASAEGYETERFDIAPGHGTRDDSRLVTLAPVEDEVSLAIPPASLDIDASAGNDAARPEVSSGALRGVVVDQAGEPVRQISVWLAPAWSDADREPRRLDMQDQVRKETRTDDRGRFGFAVVPTGRWFVGVAPSERLGAQHDEVSTLALPVEVLPGVDTTPLRLVVGRGLFLHGTLVDPAGIPLGRVSVAASEDGVAGRVWARTQDDGTFRIGPLGPRPVTVLVQRGVEYGEQPFGPFQPDARDLFLKLVPGGVLEGVVVAAEDGTLTRARIVVLKPLDDPPVEVARVGPVDGRFRIDSLERGIYSLVGSTPDGRVGLSGVIDLSASGTVRDVRLAVRAGARLDLRFESPGGQDLVLVLSKGDEPFLSQALLGARSGSYLVPTGRVLARLIDAEGTTVTQREIDLSAGEAVEVTLTP